MVTDADFKRADCIIWRPSISQIWTGSVSDPYLVISSQQSGSGSFSSASYVLGPHPPLNGYSLFEQVFVLEWKLWHSLSDDSCKCVVSN